MTDPLRRPSARYPVAWVVFGLAALAVVFFLAWPNNAAVLPSSGPGNSTASTAALVASLAPSVTLSAVPTPTRTSTPPVLQTLPSPGPTENVTATLANAALRFDGARAYQFVLEQLAFGPRPVGSAAGWKTGDYIIRQLEAFGWEVTTQEFVYKGVKGRNIIGKGGSGPVLILGAHYDTRPVADQDPDPAKRAEPILGANDGASGVAVLLELARVLDRVRLTREVWLTFFDAEDRGGLDGWPFSVGAMEMARWLTQLPEAMVLVDMIGDADQQIYFEYNSDPALAAAIWEVAKSLGYETYFIPQYKYTIIDDHLPFAQRGIPAVDIIDFDYPYWHTTQDTADKVSAASLQRVGHTLQVWLESLPAK
ncbi:MAG: M28 family peptidase [Anaerolineae bacterium]|nr:M28 family peptidase [Anaerolineae bacterium]MDW8069850.1 M28 family peptidase [Anaerolineae bacterium]